MYLLRMWGEHWSRYNGIALYMQSVALRASANANDYQAYIYFIEGKFRPSKCNIQCIKVIIVALIMICAYYVWRIWLKYERIYINESDNQTNNTC